MANKILLNVIAPLICVASPTLAQEAENPVKVDSSIEKGLDKRYLRGLGFVIAGKGAITGDSGTYGSPKYKLLEKEINGLNPRLQFCKDGSCTQLVMLARVQDSISSFSKDTNGAKFSYTDDGNGQALNFDGAIVLDVYTPGIFQGTDWNFGGYNSKDMGFHFRFGADFERAETSKATSANRREYYAGFSILAPKWTEEGFEYSLGSTMDFGYTIAQNRLTGEDSSSVSVEWKPLFKKIIGRNVQYSELKDGGWKKLFKENIKYSRTEMATQNKNVGKTSEEEDNGIEAYNPFANSFSIQPRFKVEKFLKHAVGLDDEFCGCAGIDLSTQFFEGHVKLTYKADLLWGASSHTSNFFHEIGASYYPVVDHPLFINASYKSGKRTPDFINEEIFEVGLGVQF